MTELQAGQRSQVVKRQNGWLQLKIRLSKGQYMYGWVRPSTQQFKIFRQSVVAQNNTSSAKPSASVAPQTSAAKPEAKQEKEKPDTTQQWEAWLEPDNGYQASLRVGAIYNVQDYTSQDLSFGDRQYRFGLAIEKMVASRLRLGVPVQFATNDTFKTIEAGLEASYYLWVYRALGLYAQAGSTYEYLFEGDQSFSGVNVHGGLGIDWLIHEQWSVGLMPVWLQAMVWRTEDSIPFNIRGQFVATVRTRW
jgi:hypothetical protein